MKFLVLGAAAGGGLPQWNCGCDNCNLARSGDIASATQSSLAVSANGFDWLILNASPDIRHQVQANPAMYPSGLRGSPIHSVLLTNGDIDHVAGLLSLREQTPFTLLATQEILSLLWDNGIFNAVSAEKVPRQAISLNEPITLLDDMTVTLFAVPGKVPLYQESGAVQTDLIGEQTVGVELQSGGKLAYYVPGCATIPADLLARFEQADHVFFDGTLWQDNEMVDTGTGVKTGRRMGHISICGPEGSMARLAGIKAAKTFIHINNTNPIWRPDSAERAAVLAAGWDIAADGKEYAL